jgi:hypothetical protein
MNNLISGILPEAGQTLQKLLLPTWEGVTLKKCSISRIGRIGRIGRIKHHASDLVCLSQIIVLMVQLLKDNDIEPLTTPLRAAEYSGDRI